MAVWSKRKVESSAINGGNEYEKKDRLSREQLNAITNNSFYASDVADEAKRIAENVEAGANSPVSYAPQVLSTDQQAQARENISAVGKVEGATPNDLAGLDENGNLIDTNVLMDEIVTLRGGTYIAIESNSDLKTAEFLKQGVYCCSSTTVAGSLEHCPTATSFIMVVREIGNAHREATLTWMYRFRTIMDVNGNVWTQKANTAGTSTIQWGEWTKVVTQTLLPSKSKVSFTPPSNNGKYTVTGNGWIAFSGSASTGGYIEIGTYATNSIGVRSYSHSGGGLNVYLPVRSGDVVSFYYASVTDLTGYFIPSEII